MNIVDIINGISALSLISYDHSNTTSKDNLYTKGQELEHRINSLPTQDISADEYLLKSAESLRIAAQIYLRLAYYNTPITHPSILESHEALLSYLSDITSQRQARRSFPI